MQILRSNKIAYFLKGEEMELKTIIALALAIFVVAGFVFLQARNINKK